MIRPVANVVQLRIGREPAYPPRAGEGSVRRDRSGRIGGGSCLLGLARVGGEDRPRRQGLARPPRPPRRPRDAEGPDAGPRPADRASRAVDGVGARFVIAKTGAKKKSSRVAPRIARLGDPAGFSLSGAAHSIVRAVSSYDTALIECRRGRPSRRAGSNPGPPSRPRCSPRTSRPSPRVRT